MPILPSNIFSVQKLEPYLDPESARTISVQLAANLTLAKGTLLGEITATPGVYAAYADVNADGTEVARAILPYDVVTDANGLITLTATAGQQGGEFGQKQTSIPVYYAGTFRTTELTGLDANGVADLGRLIQGTVADGILHLA